MSYRNARTMTSAQLAFRLRLTSHSAAAIVHELSYTLSSGVQNRAHTSVKFAWKHFFFRNSTYAHALQYWPHCALAACRAALYKIGQTLQCFTSVSNVILNI